jgi:hypothetical protein
MLAYAAMARSPPLLLANNATLRPSSRTIARCRIPGRDLPLLLQVGRYTTTFRISLLTLTRSVRRGLSSAPHEYHSPGNRSCPYTPPRMGWTYWRYFESRRDRCLRHDCRDYCCRLSYDRMYYVGPRDGGMCRVHGCCYGAVVNLKFDFVGVHSSST